MAIGMLVRPVAASAAVRAALDASSRARMTTVMARFSRVRSVIAGVKLKLRRASADILL